MRKDLNAHLEAGRIVAINVSRAIIGESAQRYQNAVVAEISADPGVRADRLAARGREVGEDIFLRTQRQIPMSANSLAVHVINNDGDISNAGQEFCGLLEALR